MRKDELQLLIHKILPEIYKFSVVVAPDKMLAEQNIIDAATVYLLENKKFLEVEEFDLTKRLERVRVANYLYEQLIIEIYELIEKKSILQSGVSSKFTAEYEEFNRLNCRERAVLYLHEIKEYSVNKIQKLLNMNYSSVIQSFYNAKNTLLREVTQVHELDNFIEQVANSRNLSLINSYVYGFTRKDQVDRVEKLLVHGQDMREYYQAKQNERDFFKQLIPDLSISKEDLLFVKKEIVSIVNEFFPDESRGIIQKVRKVFTSPISRINF